MLLHKDLTGTDKVKELIVKTCVFMLAILLCIMFYYHPSFPTLVSHILSFRSSTPTRPNLKTCHDMLEASHGKWDGTSYSASTCIPPKYTIQELHTCLRKANVSRIGVLGDSQGGRYLKALLSVLFPSPYWKCSLVRAEDGGAFMPDKAFYSAENMGAPNKEMVVHNRDCSGCASQHKRCTTTSPRAEPSAVDITYYVMEYVMDTEVSRFNSNTKGSSLNSTKFDASTSQEYIYKDLWNYGALHSLGYSPDNPLPNRQLNRDITLIFGTFVHDLARQNSLSFSRDLQWFLKLISYYLNSTTSKVYYFNSPRVREDKVPLRWVNVTSNMRMAEFNKIFQELYIKMTNETDGGVVFQQALDLSKMSTDFPLNLYLDAVHMNPQWHKVVMGTFVAIYCEQFLGLQRQTILYTDRPVRNK